MLPVLTRFSILAGDSGDSPVDCPSNYPLIAPTIATNTARTEACQLMVSLPLTILHTTYSFSFNDPLTILILTKLAEEAAVECANLVQPPLPWHRNPHECYSCSLTRQLYASILHCNRRWAMNGCSKMPQTLSNH